MNTDAENTVADSLALAEIRDDRLYREEFGDFDTYCRAKWQYARRHVDEIFSAAQLFKHLSANCAQINPNHESQVRPLIGLGPDQAQAAWEKAVEKAGGRKITARLVKAAMHDLQLAPKAPKPVSKIRRADRAEQRRLVDDTLGQVCRVVRGQPLS